MSRSVDPSILSRKGGSLLSDYADFSLILGGPLYQILRRAHLSGDALELLRRRIVVILSLTWLPLLVLSIVEGRAWGTAVRVPFLLDVEAHVRFLVALPLLVVAELVVHQRMRSLLRQFLERRLIPDTSRARFDAAVSSAIRLRNSVVLEMLLIGLVIVVGVVYIWPHYIALNVATWYAMPAGGGRRLSAAGWWFVYLSLPLFWFILLRWYVRLAIWVRFLWQVARCELRLVPTHPDHAGGLGFLSGVVVAFAPLLMAHGAQVAGFISNQIFFQGATLPHFKILLAVVVVFLLLIVLGPLLLFMPHLAAAKRTGLREYGNLAQEYVLEFDDKWLRSTAKNGEALLGSADLQSLADIGNSFQVIRDMSVVPFTKFTVLELAIVTLVPVAPLALTMVSVDQLITELLKVVF